MKNLNIIQATHELWKKQRSVVVGENGNMITLHSGCVEQADGKDKREIKVFIQDSAYKISSNNNVFVMQSSFEVCKHRADLVSVDS